MTVNITPVVHNALGIKTEGFKKKEEILDMFNTIEEYIAVLEDAKKAVRAKMFSVADKSEEKDDKGSAYIRLANGFGWKKEARNPAPKVNYEKALELFKSKKLTHRITIKKTIEEDKMERAISILESTAPDFVKKQEVIEDSEIETAFIQGEITDGELSSVVEKGEVTYALKMIKPK